MAKQTAKTKADRVRDLYVNLNGASRQRWEKINQQGHDFYLDNQLTQEESETLERQGMPTFTINRIIPIVEMLNFYVTANQPRWQAVGAEGSDVDVANVHADVADYIWYESDGQSKFSQVINDAATKSVGYFKISVDAHSDRGLGEVRVDTVEPFDVFIDPKSRDIFYRDAAYIMVHKVIPQSHLQKIFPEYATKIKNAGETERDNYSYSQKAEGGDFQYKDVIDETFDYFGEEDRRLDYYEMYEKIKIPYMNVFYRIEPTPEEISKIRAQVDIEMEAIQKELQVKMQETILQLNQQLQAGNIIEERFTLELEKLEKQTEQQIIQTREQKISQAMEAVSRVENNVVSEKEFKVLMKGELKNSLIDAIKFYEARIKLTCVIGDTFMYEAVLPGLEYPIVPIHYKWTGTPYPMSAVAPLVGKQQELNKAHQLMIHNASLGSSLRYLYQEGSIDEDYWERYASAPGALLPVRQGFEAPSIVQPAPISTAFANIVELGKTDMEYLAGIYSSMQGDIQAQHDTFKGLLANDEYGTRRVKTWMKNSVEPSLQHLGEVVRDYAQATYKSNKVFRIVEPNNENIKDVEVNIIQYNKYGDAIGKFFDYETAKFDVRLIAGSTMPVNRWAYLKELMEMLKLGIVDDIAVLAEADIKGKDKIAQRKSQMAQMRQALEKAQQEIKEGKGTIETLSRQLVQAGIKDKQRMVEHDMRKQLLDTSAKLKGDTAVARANQDLQNERSKDMQRNQEKEFKQLVQNGLAEKKEGNNLP
jgi:ketosteroid isomerase-like protein